MLTFILAVMIVLLLFGFYRESIEAQSYLAIGLMTSYLALYLFVPPYPGTHHTYVANMFSLISLLSFNAVLFPGINPFFPTGITRTVGWCGLIGISVLLCIYKLSGRNISDGLVL